MNFEEYKKFIEERRNKEEREAIRVVDVILKYHVDERWSEYSRDSVELYPHFVFNGEKERIEMDLLIVLKHPNSRYERKIGVEFKETDVEKVLAQACLRKNYVDYMYIATRDIKIDYKHVFIMSFFGIGWIIWEEGFAKIIFPARYTTTDYIFEDLINTALRVKLEEKKEEIKREIDKIVKLDKFIEESRG